MTSPQLTQEQIDQLHQWAAEGLDLNGMQKRMNEEMGLRLTYMDARFLLLDLKIDLIVPKVEKPAKPAPAPVSPMSTTGMPQAQTQAQSPMPSSLFPSMGTTQVTIDEITPPHALLTGKMTFMSGAQGIWSIDKMGRIDWEPIAGEPTEADLQSFEKELQKVLRSQMGGI
ncbi:MAG: hypothetical protein RR719_04115 [Akkermansia sp.]